MFRVSALGAAIAIAALLAVSVGAASPANDFTVTNLGDRQGVVCAERRRVAGQRLGPLGGPDHAVVGV